MLLEELRAARQDIIAFLRERRIGHPVGHVRAVSQQGLTAIVVGSVALEVEDRTLVRLAGLG